MVQKITWLPIAQATFLETLKYLEKDFSEKDIQKFADRVQQKLLLIKAMPGIGIRCKKPGIYKTVLHKKTLLFYRYKPSKHEIVLLAFWNTQQDPGKLKW